MADLIQIAATMELRDLNFPHHLLIRMDDLAANKPRAEVRTPPDDA